LSDLGPLVAFLFSGRLAISAEALRSGKLDDAALREALTFALREVDTLPEFTAVALDTMFKGIAEETGRKVRDLARPFYVAITGSPTSLPLYDSMELLGRDLVRERLRGALDVLEKAS